MSFTVLVFCICIVTIILGFIANLFVLGTLLERYNTCLPPRAVMIGAAFTVLSIALEVWFLTTIHDDTEMTKYLVAQKEYELEDKTEIINLFALYYQANPEAAELIGIAHPEPQKPQFLQYWIYEKQTRKILWFDFSDKQERYSSSKTTIICPVSWIDEIKTRNVDLNMTPLPETTISNISDYFA